MPTLSMIVFCLIGAALFAGLYWLGRLLRKGEAWALRKEGPKERVGFFLVLFAVLGAVIGGMAHNPVQAMMACKATGQSAVSCLF